MRTHPAESLRSVIRDAIARTVGAVGLLGIALIHTIDAPSHFVGGPDTWLGVAYVGLIVSCVIFAAGLIFVGDRRIWLAAGGVVVTTLIGFTLSRVAGLPGDSGDIGNWGEALGIASVFVEGSFLMLTAGVLGYRVPESAHAVGARAMSTAPERAPRNLAPVAG
ncbi:MAG TPA: hypothetical protein VG388_14445 [Solirubrobacteraceae bacterium]|jgi:hypothetical protein|nr:hypothetical protein [Solirubrobacteraceae bacterium]